MHLTLLCHRTSRMGLSMLAAAAFGVVGASAQTQTNAPEESHDMYPARTWEVPDPDGLRHSQQSRLRISMQEAAVAGIRAKSQRIIVPEAVYNDIRLADVIEALRRESVRLDKDSPSNQRGVSISVLPPPVVKFYSPDNPYQEVPPPPTAPTTDPLDKPITLNLYNRPLFEVLAQVAKEVGMTLKVSEKGIQLVRCAVDCQDDIVREFHVPPWFSELKTAPRENVQSILEANGIQFPAGTAATYLPATNRLIIRNTEENIALVELLFTEDPALSTSTPANP